MLSQYAARRADGGQVLPRRYSKRGQARRFGGFPAVGVCGARCSGAVFDGRAMDGGDFGTGAFGQSAAAAEDIGCAGRNRDRVWPGDRAGA